MYIVPSWVSIYIGGVDVFLHNGFPWSFTIMTSSFLCSEEMDLLFGLVTLIGDGIFFVEDSSNLAADGTQMLSIHVGGSTVFA